MLYIPHAEYIFSIIMVTFHLSVIGSLQVIHSLKRALQPAVTDVSV